MNKDKMLDELSVLQERFANGMGWRDGEYEEALDEAIELINKMSSADVVEIKHGEWTEKYEEEAPMFLKRRWVCSVCGKWQTHGRTSFCPNCGADMRERKETE